MNISVRGRYKAESTSKTESRKTPEEKEKELEDMKKNHPTHPDYKPPKNWNGKKVRMGDKIGWPAKNGDVWEPDAHAEDSHSPHWDIQHPGGTISYCISNIIKYTM